MKRFKSPGQAQRRFLSAHDGINNLILPCRHHVLALQCRATGIEAFVIWAGITGVAVPQ